MSYIDQISPKHLSTFEVVADFGKYYDDQVKSKSTVYGSPISIEITSCIFESEGGFIGEYRYPIRFHNCYFKKTLSFFECRFKKEFTISNCFFDEALFFIESVFFEKPFNIFGCSVKKFMTTGGEFGKCFWNILDCDSCNIGMASFADLRLIVEGKGVDSLQLWTNSISGFVTVTGDSFINKFQIEGFSKDLALSIEDIGLNSLRVHRYRSDSGLKFLKLRAIGKDSQISISESYLGSAEFYLVNFSEFNSVSIIDSHILDCSFVNVVWPNEVEGMQRIFFMKGRTGTPDNNALSKEEMFKWRETFRQLKYAYGKQGDVINEQKFHSLEMIAFDNSLKWKGNRLLKIIIKFSNWFSEFGQSVSRPFIALLAGNLIIFFILLASGLFKPLHISIEGANWRGFWQGVYRYIWLINPLRKADDTFNNGFILMDVFARVWSSYMIYNIIRATRRFIK